MKLYFLTLFVLFSLCAYSKIDPIIPFDKVIIKDGLPQEFGLLIKSYQNYKLTMEEKEEFREFIYGLDHSFKIISNKNIIYYNLNLELHKMLIDYFPKKTLRQFPDQKAFILSLKKITLSTNEDFPFLRWVMDKVIIELKSLVSSPHYKSILLLQTKQKRPKKSEIISIKKRIEMLLPWYKIFKTLPPPKLALTLKPIMHSLVLRLYTNSKLQAQLVSHENILSAKTPQDLTFFEEVATKKIDSTLKPKEKPKKIEDILDIKTKILSIEDLPKPVNDWIPKDDDFNKSLFPDSSLDYIAPEELPDAVNDWESFLNSNEEYDFFPGPDSNYQAPKKLPSPESEWKPRD